MQRTSSLLLIAGAVLGVGFALTQPSTSAVQGGTPPPRPGDFAVRVRMAELEKGVEAQESGTKANAAGLAEAAAAGDSAGMEPRTQEELQGAGRAEALKSQSAAEEEHRAEDEDSRGSESRGRQSPGRESRGRYSPGRESGGRRDR